MALGAVAVEVPLEKLLARPHHFAEDFGARRESELVVVREMGQAEHFPEAGVVPVRSFGAPQPAPEREAEAELSGEVGSHGDDAGAMAQARIVMVGNDIADAKWARSCSLGFWVDAVCWREWIIAACVRWTRRRII